MKSRERETMLRYKNERKKLKTKSMTSITEHLRPDTITVNGLTSLSLGEKEKEHILRSAYMRARKDNTPDFSDDESEIKKSVDLSTVNLTTTSTGNICSFITKQFIQGVLGGELPGKVSPWVINNVDALSYFGYSVDDVAMPTRTRIVSGVVNDGNSTYLLTAPFGVLVGDNEDQLELNPMNKLDEVGTYMRKTEYGYCKNSSGIVENITLHSTFEANLTEITGIHPPISSSPTAGSSFCLPYEFAYMAIIASGLMPGGSAGYTATTRVVSDKIIARINTYIFGRLHLTASGVTLTSLAVPMETWFVLLCNFFNRLVAGEDGAILSFTGLTDTNKRIVADSVNFNTASLQVYAPSVVAQKRYNYRAMVNYPLKLQFPAEIGTIVKNKLVIPAGSVDAVLNIDSITADSKANVCAMLKGLLFVDRAGLIMLSSTDNQAGLVVKVDGVVCDNVGYITEDAADTFQIVEKSIGSSDTNMLYNRSDSIGLNYMEGSSYEFLQAYHQSRGASTIGFSSWSGLAKLIFDAHYNLNFDKTPDRSGWTFSWEDYGATRTLKMAGSINTEGHETSLMLPLAKPSRHGNGKLASGSKITIYNCWMSDTVLQNGYITLCVVSPKSPYSILEEVTYTDTQMIYDAKAHTLVITLSNLSLALSANHLFLKLKCPAVSGPYFELGTIETQIVYEVDSSDVIYDAENLESAALGGTILSTYNKKEHYFDCGKWLFDTVTVSVNPVLNYGADAGDAENYVKVMDNMFKACINSSIIRHAFADLRQLDYSKVVELIELISGDVDPLIYSHLASAVKAARSNRLIEVTTALTDVIVHEDVTIPEDLTDIDDVRVADYAAEIDAIKVEVDKRFAADYPDKTVTGPDDAGKWWTTIGSLFSKGAVNETTGKVVNIPATPENSGITADGIPCSDSSERAIVLAIYDEFKANSLSELATKISILERDSNVSIVGTYAYYKYKVANYMLGQINAIAHDELVTLRADSIVDAVEDAIDNYLDDEKLYSAEDGSTLLSTQIDNLVNTVTASIAAGKGEVFASLKASMSSLDEFIESNIANLKERVIRLSTSLKSNALEYYSTAKAKLTEGSETLNNLLSFKVSNLLSSVLNYGDDLKSYLSNFTGTATTNTTDYGWQDTTLFTPASGISLATGIVTYGLGGALSAALSLIKKVATGLADKVRGALTAAVVDGASFKRRLTGFETLSLQCASKQYSAEYFSETYTWLAEKVFSVLTGYNDYYMVSQVDNLYLFFQDIKEGMIMVTANPKLRLNDDTDVKNDWNIAECMADSIISCIESQNAILAKARDIGILPTFSAYEVPDRDFLLEDILNRAQAKTAESVVVAKSIIWGIGLLLGAVLCCTGYGTVAGISLIAGCSAVGSAMCGTAETQSKIERLENDSTYANSLIMSADLRDIWCDALPSSMIDLELSLLDFLSNCRLNYANGSYETKTTGRSANLWDEQWERGQFNWSTGEPIDNSTRYRSKSFTIVKPSTSYFMVSPNDIEVLFYDRSKGFIKNITIRKNTHFSTPSNAYYLKICNAYQADYNDDVAIFEDSTAYYDLVSDGSSGAVDPSLVSETDEYDGLGFVPLVVLAGAPKFKYSLVTDTARALKSLSILTVAGAVVGMAVGKAASATITRVRKKKLAKLQAKQWAEESPSASNYCSQDADGKDLPMTADQKRAYDLDKATYAKTQTSLSWKANRLDNAISNSGAFASSAGSVFSTVANYPSEQGAGDNPAAAYSEAAVNGLAEVQPYISHTDNLVDAVYSSIFERYAMLDTGDGDAPTNAIEDIIARLQSIANNTGGDALTMGIIAALASACGLSVAGFATLLVKAMKNSASKKSSENNV